MTCTNPVTLLPKRNKFGRYNIDPGKYPQGLSVPCGRCVSCRIKRTQEWTLRMLHELEDYDHASFVTLTYNDEFLPFGNDSFGSLCKKDLQKYFKRLRKSLCERKIRYYACGEYGELSQRPHYHFIVFGLHPLQDADLIKDAWRFGYVSIGNVSADSIKYVAKYCQKQYSGEMAVEEYVNKEREPVFKLSSLGIGRSYIVDHADQIKRLGYITYKGTKLSIPRYYINKMGLNNNYEFMEAQRCRVIDAERELNDEHFGINLTDDESYLQLTAGEYAVIDQRKRQGRYQNDKNIKARLALKRSKL